MYSRTLLRTAAALVAATLSTPSSAAAQGAPVVVELRGDSLVAPRDFTAGTISVRFRAKGAHGTMLHVFRIPLGVEFESFRSRVMGATPGHVDGLAVGGPAPARDSIEAVTTLDARQGRYLMVAAPAGGPFPRAKSRYAMTSAVMKYSVLVAPGFVVDATITLSDKDARASNALRAGRRRLKVHNDGPAQHGLLVVRAKPGRTRADALEWLRTGKGVRPFNWTGGVSPMASGRDAWMDLDFEKGEYLLLCPVRANGGRPHAEGAVHGTLTVR